MPPPHLSYNFHDCANIVDFFALQKKPLTPILQHSFGAGQVIAHRIACHSHPDGLCKCLEYCLDLMMLVFSPTFNIQVALCSITE